MAFYGNRWSLILLELLLLPARRLIQVLVFQNRLTPRAAMHMHIKFPLSTARLVQSSGEPRDKSQAMHEAGSLLSIYKVVNIFMNYRLVLPPHRIRAGTTELFIENGFERT